MNLDDLVEALGARWEEEIHMLCERKRGTPALQEDLEPTKVFLVHGHDKHTRVEVENLLRKLGLDPIVLQDEPSRGQTIIEKFEQNAKSVAFAIVLLTPDDEGRPAGSESLRKRARQNVIFELGYFLAALKRGKVCALMAGNIEVPSDFAGVVYIQKDEGEAWHHQMAKEMRAAGLRVNSDRL